MFNVREQVLSADLSWHRRVLLQIVNQIALTKRQILAETLEAIRCERLRTVQDVDELLTQRGVVCGLPAAIASRASEPAKGDIDAALPLPELQLKQPGTGESQKQTLRLPAASSGVQLPPRAMAGQAPCPAADGKELVQPPHRLAIQRAQVNVQTAVAADTLAEDDQPLSAKSRQSDRSRRAAARQLQPEPWSDVTAPARSPSQAFEQVGWTLLPEWERCITLVADDRCGWWSFCDALNPRCCRAYRNLECCSWPLRYHMSAAEEPSARFRYARPMIAACAAGKPGHVERWHVGWCGGVCRLTSRSVRARSAARTAYSAGSAVSSDHPTQREAASPVGGS